MDTSYIDLLNFDCWFNVLQYLNEIDLLNLNITCHYFNELIKTSSKNLKLLKKINEIKEYYENMTGLDAGEILKILDKYGDDALIIEDIIKNNFKRNILIKTLEGFYVPLIIKFNYVKYAKLQLYKKFNESHDNTKLVLINNNNIFNITKFKLHQLIKKKNLLLRIKQQISHMTVMDDKFRQFTKTQPYQITEESKIALKETENIIKSNYIKKIFDNTILDNKKFIDNLSEKAFKEIGNVDINKCEIIRDININNPLIYINLMNSIIIKNVSNIKNYIYYDLNQYNILFQQNQLDNLKSINIFYESEIHDSSDPIEFDYHKKRALLCNIEKNKNIFHNKYLNNNTKNKLNKLENELNEIHISIPEYDNLKDVSDLHLGSVSALSYEDFELKPSEIKSLEYNLSLKKNISYNYEFRKCCGNVADLLPNIGYITGTDRIKVICGEWSSINDELTIIDFVDLK